MIYLFFYAVVVEKVEVVAKLFYFIFLCFIVYRETVVVVRKVEAVTSSQ